MKEKTILHVDVNNFFASVECSTNPKLKNLPVAVAGNPEKRTGIILAKNQLAKEQGVCTGEAIWQAKTKCPNLVTLAPHYDLYEKISKQLHNLYLNYTDLVEPLGLDECWLDVTPSLKYLQKTGAEIANEIREKVKKEFGFTVSVGVSFSKIFAKLGSDMKKPDATTVISKDDFKQKTYNLPLNSIIGIGSRLTTRFEKMNITTIGDFVSLKESFVKDVMGKTGVELREKLLGTFHDKVACYFDLQPPKSIGNGTTTILDIVSKKDIEKVLAFLCEKVSRRLTNGNFQTSTITLTIKTNNFEKFRRSQTYAPMRSEEEIFSNACKILDSFWNFDRPVRAIRVRISNLQKLSKIKQLSFLTEDADNLEQSIKNLKDKYGNDAIYIASDTASFINRKGH